MSFNAFNIFSRHHFWCDFSEGILVRFWPEVFKCFCSFMVAGIYFFKFFMRINRISVPPSFVHWQKQRWHEYLCEWCESDIRLNRSKRNSQRGRQMASYCSLESNYWFSMEARRGILRAHALCELDLQLNVPIHYYRTLFLIGYPFFSSIVFKQVSALDRGLECEITFPRSSRFSTIKWSTAISQLSRETSVWFFFSCFIDFFIMMIFWK